MINRSTFINLAIFTLFGFTLLGYFIIINYVEQSFIEMITGRINILAQLGIGIGYGFVTAFIGWKIIETSTLKPVRFYFSSLIQRMNLKYTDIILVSISAGIGEEVLFRGAVQPLLGIWLTAIIFVAIHGYLNPFNWRLAIYGVFMTLIIAGIGYLKVYAGLVTCMAAHTIIDVYLLYKLMTDPITQEEKEI